MTETLIEGGSVNHKEMTAHVRDRIKVAGIKASVRKQAYCGGQIIRVGPVGGPDARFTEAEQDTIALIGKVNGLTFVQGMPIAASYGGHHVHGSGFVFYMPGT